jgi:hypothetical protein
MKRKAFKRLHSEDARMLRTLLLDVMGRLIEVESAVGLCQDALGLYHKPELSEDVAEILEA